MRLTYTKHSVFVSTKRNATTNSRWTSHLNCYFGSNAANNPAPANNSSNCLFVNAILQGDHKS